MRLLMIDSIRYLTLIYRSMPVTKSAKKALRTATRRKQENVLQRAAFKGALKSVRKAVETGSTELASLVSAAQSSLDKAAKNNTIHPNKAARLKSRMAKRLTTEAVAATPKKIKTAASKSKAKATTAAKKKATVKKA